MQDSDRLHLLPHHPKNISDDALGSADYARTICGIFTELTAENTGLTIGIFGDWGRGKSTVLNMTRELLSHYNQRTSQNLWHRLKKMGQGLWYRTVRRSSRKGRLLQLVREQRQRPGVKPQLYRPVIVHFDAWKYSKDQVWVALLRKIVDTIDENLPYRRRFITRLSLWRRRFQWKGLRLRFLSLALRVIPAMVLLLAFVSAVVLISFLLLRGVSSQIPWLRDLINWLASSLGVASGPILPPVQAQQGWFDEFLSWLRVALGVTTGAAAIWFLLTALLKIVQQSARSVLRGVGWIFTAQPSLPPGLFRPALEKDTLFASEQFSQELHDLIQVAGRNRPIVVLIDDLDRAPIDQITPVLEAIKHFGVKPDVETHDELRRWRAPITFVIAADREVMQSAIASHYKDFWATLDDPRDTDTFAREYLEKVIQIPFELPPLSSHHLLRLSEETVTPPTKDAYGIWTLASARQMALRKVIVYAPKENPRAAVQAYNTFQALWRVVQRRKLKTIEEPGLLAALILIHYIWPKVFQQFFRYPELFFDLHALATKTPNKLCSRTEIEELLSLGCPAVTTAAIDQIQLNHPGLLRLLANLRLSEQMDGSQLFAYLTLVEDQPAPTGIHLTESGAALLSGDPSLIKFATRANRSQVLQEHLPWLMEFLETNGVAIERRSIAKPPGDLVAPPEGPHRQTTEGNMSRALFALGRIGDGRAIEPIKRILDTGPVHSTTVLERAIFALAHLAERSTSRQEARRNLIDLLTQEQISFPLQLRILRLLRSALVQESEVESAIRLPLIQIALRHEMKLMRDTALEFATRGSWLEETFVELNAGPHTRAALEGYFQVVENAGEDISRLPMPIEEHLAGIASDADSLYQERAFKVLANFPNVDKVITYMSAVATETQDIGILKLAIGTMGERQASTDLDWKAEEWKRIERILIDEPTEAWVSFTRALRVSRRPEAISYLAEIRAYSDPRVQKAATEELYAIADSGDNKELAKKAQSILDEWEVSDEPQ